MRFSLAAIQNNKILLPLLTGVCVLIVALSSILGMLINLAVIGAIGFLIVFYVSYRFPRYNIPILLGLNFYVPLLVKMFGLYDLPLGIANEGLCVLMLLTLALNGKLSGLRTLPAILLSIWILFQITELVNPNSASRVAGIFAIRGQLRLVIYFFIMYSSMDRKRDAYLLFIGWFIFGLTSGLYGLYQEFLGLPSYDLFWATSDEELYNLLFTWGRMRKFSFFLSPSEFGMIMAVTGVAASVLFFYSKKIEIKVLSVVTSFICLWSMIYTGSRTAMILLPLGFFIFAVITLHRKILLTVAGIVLVGSVMVLRPSSGAMYVMSTAFSGTEDPSMAVRLRNQAIIRSYIRTNPIGYGLGSTGNLGRKYSPNTFIGNFPPDSEYVKIAIETGWIGLLFWCSTMAILFGYGVSVYFKTKDTDWRALLVIVLILLFMIIVGQYPQEVFTSQVFSVVFPSLIAVMAKIKLLTTAKSPIDEIED